MENKMSYYNLSGQDKDNIKKWITDRMLYAVNQVMIERNEYQEKCGIKLDTSEFINPIKRDVCPNDLAIDVLISISYEMMGFNELFDIEFAEEYTDMFLRIFGIHGLCKPNVYKRFVEILRGMEEIS